MPLRPACPGTEIARAPPLTTRARSSRSRVPRGKRSSRPTSSGAQGSRRSGGGLAPARRRAVALPASRVLSLGSALRGAALALLRCRERHDGSPAEARDSSGPRVLGVTGINGGRREALISLDGMVKSLPKGWGGMVLTARGRQPGGWVCQQAGGVWSRGGLRESTIPYPAKSWNPGSWRALAKEFSRGLTILNRRIFDVDFAGPTLGTGEC